MKVDIKRLLAQAHHLVKSSHGKTWLVAFGLFFLTITTGFLHHYSEKKFFKQSTFTKWQKMYQKSIESNKYFQTRIPASTSHEFACLSESMVEEKIIQHIAILESRFDSGKPIEGEWNGLKLDTLPTPQAQYLLDYAKLVSTGKINFATCPDLICAMTQIYQAYEHPAPKQSALVTYFWYLKTGSVLDMSKPELSFSPSQLASLWKLASALPDNFFHLPGFRSISKSNQLIDKCWDHDSAGKVLISTQCIDSLKSEKEFLLSFTDAISFHIDNHPFIAQKSFSMSEEWINLANWQPEYLLTSDHQFLFQWHYQTNQEDQLFINQHAMTSPERHLKSSIAYFRFMPEKAQKLSDQLKSIISNNFFDLDNYTSAGLLNRYLKMANRVWDNQESEHWIDCFNQHFDVDMIAQQQDKSPFQKINNQLYSCMEKKIPSFTAQIFKTIKNSELEGCDFFYLDKYSDQADHFIELLTRNLSKKIFKGHFELEKWGVQLLLGLNIKNSIESEVDPTSFYVSCTNHDDVKNCYQNRFGQFIEKFVAKQAKVHPLFLSELKQEILTRYRFDEIRLLSESKIRQFLFPYYAELKNKAQDQWQSCLKQKVGEHTKVKSYTPYDGAEYFVSANLINCLNSSAKSLVSNILSTPLNIKFDNGKEYHFELMSLEKDYAAKHLTKKLVLYYNEFTMDAHQEQKSYLTKFFNEKGPQLVYDVVSQEDFLKGVYSQAQVKEKCLSSISNYYPEANHFYSHNEVKSNFGKELCYEVLKNQKVQRAVASSIKQEWSNTKTHLLTQFKDQYQNLIDRCYDKYPTKLSIHLVKNSRLRQDCLEAEHLSLKDKLITRFNQSEQAEYFQEQQVELAMEIDQLKQDIIQKMKSTEALIQKR